MARPPKHEKPATDGFKVSLGSLLKQKLAEVPPELAVKLAEEPARPEAPAEEQPRLVLHARKKARGRRTRIRVDVE